ncbi:MAG TPA: AAA-like domain-containing protein, partial [Polyangiaceae bacterium]
AAPRSQGKSKESSAPASVPASHVFFQHLLSKLADGVRMPIDVRAWWEKSPSESIGVRFVRFVQEALIDPGKPTIVFLDEVDATLELPYTDELYTAIRHIYNERAANPDYSRIAFCLMGVLTPDELIKNRKVTPYNVGRSIHLTDFDATRDDLRPLAEVLSAAGFDGEQELSRVLALTHGHPFLTMALIDRMIARAKGGARLGPRALIDEELTGSSTPMFDVHFSRIEELMTARLTEPGVAYRLYKDVLSGKRITDKNSKDVEVLKLAGVVRRDAGGALVIRNEIYQRRFGPAWLAEVMPPRITAWMWSALIVTASVAAVTSLIAWTVVVNNRRKETEEQRAITAAVDDARVKIRKPMPAKQFIELYQGLAPRAPALADSLVDEYLQTRTELFDSEARSWLQAGNQVIALLLYGFAADRGTRLGAPAPPTPAESRRNHTFDQFVGKQAAWRMHTVWFNEPRVTLGGEIPQDGGAAGERCYSVRVTSSSSSVASCERDAYAWLPTKGTFKLSVGALDAFALTPDGKWFIGITTDRRVVWRDLDALDSPQLERTILLGPRGCRKTNALQVFAAGEKTWMVLGCDEGMLVDSSLSLPALNASVGTKAALTERQRGTDSIPFPLVMTSLGRPSGGGAFVPVNAVERLGEGVYAVGTEGGLRIWTRGRFHNVGTQRPVYALAWRDGRLAVADESSVRVYERTSAPDGLTEVAELFNGQGTFVQVALLGDHRTVCGLLLGAGARADEIVCSEPGKIDFPRVGSGQRLDGLISAGTDGLLLATVDRVIGLERRPAPAGLVNNWDTVRDATGLTLSSDEQNVRLPVPGEHGPLSASELVALLKAPPATSSPRR